MAPTDRQIIDAARAASPDGRITGLFPFAIRVEVLAGHDPKSFTTLTERSMMATPVPHPVLVALLNAHGARRRGSYTWSIGLGEDTYTNTALHALCRAVHLSSIIPEQHVRSARGPKNFTEALRHRGYALQRMFDGTPAFVPQFLDPNWAGNEGDYRNHRQTWAGEVDTAARGVCNEGAGFNPGGGAVLLSTDGRQIWIKFATDRFDIGHLLPDGVEAPRLNVRAPGRNPVEPRAMYPADVFAATDELRELGFTVFDPEDTKVARVRHHLVGNVVAWPMPGRPAEASVSVGANLTATDGHTSQRRFVSTDELADLIDEFGEDRCVIAPAVRDVVRLHAVAPVDDERLRPHQRLVVARHAATNLGFVNACAVGLGKTVMTLDGMRRRAQLRSPYRGLVIVEANVRDQWSGEAEVWFPEATVVTVNSRSDVDSLVSVLRMAADSPVVVITSYALASDVTRAMDAGETADIDGNHIPMPAPAVDDVIVVDTQEELEGQLSFFGTSDDNFALKFTFTPVSVPAPIVEERADSDIDEVVPSLGAVLAAVDWADVIADEAVVLANPGSRQSKALWHLRARSEVAVALTGTPIDRSVDDLGRLIAWVRNDAELFHGNRLDSTFDLSDEQGRDDFQRAIGPIVIRHDQSEIRGEIPRFRPVVERVHLHAAELSLANAARTELKKVYDELVVLLDQVATADPDNESLSDLREGLKAARGAWLGGTTLARTAAADPESLRMSTSAGAAMLEAQGLVDAACEVGGSKRRRAVELVVDRVRNGEKVLVFTEFAQAARAIIGDLAAMDIRVGGVLGGGGKTRDRNVRDFRAGDLDVLVCTAAGEKGLNLQMATCVIHYDLPWTPRKIVQRTGRAARIGSTSTEIEVLFLIAGDTVEERVAGVVVARAAKALQALDAHRGVKLADTEFGQVLAALAPEVSEIELDDKENQLLQLTRVALAA